MSFSDLTANKLDSFNNQYALGVAGQELPVSNGSTTYSLAGDRIGIFVDQALKSSLSQRPASASFSAAALFPPESGSGSEIPVALSKKRGAELISSPEIAPIPSSSKKRRSSSVSRAKAIGMKELYSKHEGPKVFVFGKETHFYPTPEVQQAFGKFVHCREWYRGQGISFSGFLERRISDKKLPAIGHISTLYFPNNFLSKKKVDIANNEIIRNGAQLEPGKYVAVIREDNQLYVTKKKRKGKHGRVHHSSLSNGKAVKFAGEIKVSPDRQQLSITNLSGHYCPPPEIIEILLNKWEEDGLSFTKESETTDDSNAFGPLRTVTIRRQSSLTPEKTLR
ncbi:MAG: hypothetical protein ACI9S8_001991 [Chlamydiales bacterium]|jgi:hypothetical protein